MSPAMLLAAGVPGVAAAVTRRLALGQMGQMGAPFASSVGRCSQLPPQSVAVRSCLLSRSPFTVALQPLSRPRLA